MTPLEKIDIGAKFALFSEHSAAEGGSPHSNGQEMKLVKVQGTFPWHHHETAEEMFLVWRGTFRVEFRDRIVTMAAGRIRRRAARRRASHRR